MKRKVGKTIMKNIKYLKLVKKVITIPSGYSTLREHGNILKDGNRFIFTSTAVRKVNDEIEYSTHYWTSTNKENWTYKGKLNLPYQSEDLHLSKDGGKYIAMYENKSVESTQGFIISYATCDSLSGVFAHYPTFGYEPSMTGISTCLAVYSPLRVNALKCLLDWRSDDSELNKENVGIADWQGNKWGTIRTIMRPNDYGYDTLGVGGSIHKLDNEYVLELAGGIDWTPPPNKYIKWVNGLVLLDSNFNVKRMLNRVLKDKDGNAVWATFANDGDWFALSRKRGTNDVYLAEIVTDETPQNDDYSEHINNDPTLPKHSPTVSDNVLLMRVIRPILERWLDEATAVETKEEILYMIDLIDEIS